MSDGTLQQMHPTARSIVWSAATAIAVMLIGSLLPIWTAWNVRLRDEFDYRSTLWGTLWQIPANWRNSEPGSGYFWAIHRLNLFKALLLAVAASGTPGLAFALRKYQAFFFIGGVLALGVFVTSLLGLRFYSELALFLPSLGMYVLVLLMASTSTKEPEPDESSGEDLNCLVKMKRQGALLIRPSYRRTQRFGRFILKQDADRSSDEALDRLVAVKRQIVPQFTPDTCLARGSTRSEQPAINPVLASDHCPDVT